MSEPDDGAPRTDWRRIGLIATVLLVPGGFLLGGMLAARRMRDRAEAVEPDPDDTAR